MGTIIAFHGCKGGAGTTFLAAETVALLSAKGRRIPERAMSRYDRGYTTYVLVQNPNAEAVQVTVTYMTGSGPKVQPAITMPPKCSDIICLVC